MGQCKGYVGPARLKNTGLGPTLAIKVRFEPARSINRAKPKQAFFILWVFKQPFGPIELNYILSLHWPGFGLAIT